MKANFNNELSKVVGDIGFDSDKQKIDKVKAMEFEISNRQSEQPEIYRSGTTDEWRNKLDKNTIECIEKNAGFLMKKFGYF